MPGRVATTAPRPERPEHQGRQNRHKPYHSIFFGSPAHRRRRRKVGFCLTGHTTYRPSIVGSLRRMHYAGASSAHTPVPAPPSGYQGIFGRWPCPAWPASPTGVSTPAVPPRTPVPAASGTKYARLRQDAGRIVRHRPPAGDGEPGQFSIGRSAAHGFLRPGIGGTVRGRDRAPDSALGLLRARQPSRK